MVMRRGYYASRPPMPTQLLEMSPDEYFDWLVSRGYSEHAATKELEKLETFHAKYLPPKKQTINSVPVKDTTDKAYKALERVLRKKNKDDESSTDSE